MFQEGKKEKGHDRKRVSMGISRRGMLKSMGVLGVGLAATGAMTALGCSSSDGSGEGLTFADTVAWDGEYDVVVIGFGAAGATAATYAARDGAKVLIVEKEAQGGGDSAISDQLINIALDYDEAYKYNSVDLAGALLDEELLQMICQGQVDLKSTLVELGGDESQFVVFSEGASMTEHEGSSTFQMITMHEGKSDGFAYQTLQNTVKSMPDQIDVWLATPAKKLLQDPISKTIVGVLVERDKKDVLIRAKNGVVLAAGGYAFNEQMVADFNEMQLDKVRFNCSPNNTGEVIKMAMEIGADLWHMSHLNGNIFCAPVAEGTMAGFGILLEAMKGGSIELFGQGGDRIYNITTGARYGKYLINGKWQIPHWTDYNYLVFDQKKFEEISTAENNPFELYPEELASKIEMDPTGLTQGLDEFHRIAAGEVDTRCDRPAETMAAFDDGPFYAFRIMPCYQYTFGGPKRNAKAEVIGIDGSPIPHLYGAGVCGSSTLGGWPGAIIFGKAAGKNAAAEKEALPAYEVAKVESNITYTPGTENDLA